MISNMVLFQTLICIGIASTHAFTHPSTFGTHFLLPRKALAFSRSSSSSFKHKPPLSYVVLQASFLTDEQMKSLSEKDYVIIPNFISDELIHGLNSDVENLRSQNKFNIAKIGQDSSNTLNTDIRVAETCFIGNEKTRDLPSSSNRSELYNVLNGLQIELSGNEKLDVLDGSGEVSKGAPALDTNLSELLYAYYPEGGFYRRHRDAIAGSASVLRCYSLLLYINPPEIEWKDEYGGQLRLHMDSGE